LSQKFGRLRHVRKSGLSAELLAELRRDVALANRIVHAAGLVSAFGHVSARVPGTDTFVFPTRASPALADADRLLVLDLDGKQREGEGDPNTELWIHARIYAARPDVGGVAHVHSPACVALGQIGQPLQVLHNSASVFADGVPLFERVGLIRTRELGDQVAATLGQRRAMLLRSWPVFSRKPPLCNCAPWPRPAAAPMRSAASRPRKLPWCASRSGRTDR